MEENTGTVVETTTEATQSAQSAETDTSKESANNDAQTEEKGQEVTVNETEAKLEKLVQAEADRRTKDMGKTIADLKKQLDTLQKASMTAEEIKQLEITQKEQELQDKEREITEKENRLFIVEAVKKAGLDDGGDYVLDFYDLVYADTQDQITANVEKLKSAIDKRVASEVDKTFRAGGRTPKGAQNGAQGGTVTENTIAEQLGKRIAEQRAASNSVLEHYYGGNK